ncbi:FAD:protein FMN transferase [Clostridium botulinum]|uniref:FAD:protein FMN transferase n=1 Tax=Clostridium botulinum (strain Hall / ATCC 3502 / NCTC 13319 / Type A) TaxID=441771 RepID=A5HYS1_CLOBH|nr:FAD:protein FMN transferase [Clostridium botulinum]NFL70157.1 FAD:protein FMN transferase [Clostridium botulinum]NFQ52080.1 FAD:protein FMN transferase [Clostridium botulinum]NFT47110.1 FAD:protein FMN transferase [Clostridium botulinum]QGT43747.1 FAD:protein FMN transferase [Clostridium botulinum]CAL81930.1 putative lipoprotein [Clostridium botulinum A str. ATCC 3502]
MKIKYVTILLLCICLPLVFVGCDSKSEEPVSRETYLMGTIINIKAYGKDADKAVQASVDKISDIENKMSLNISTSEVNKINKNAGIVPVKVSKNTFDVVKASLIYSEKSKGSFDITVEPLVSLWGIGTDKARIPSKDEINNALKLINYKDVIINEKESTVMLKRKGQAIDLGAIAKGYTADELKKVLLNYNVSSAFLSLGGNVYVLGNKPDKTLWKIGVQNPLEPRGDYLGIVSVSDKSVVTSGNYERFFERNGKRYHHIFDTKTGYPAEKGLISVSIISDKSIDGDALSTSVYTLGLDEGKKLIESLKGVEAIFVTNDKKVYVTSGLKDIFKLTNTDFKLQNK